MRPSVADISWLIGWFVAATGYLLLVAFVPGTARYEQEIAMTARQPGGTGRDQPVAPP